MGGGGGGGGLRRVRFFFGGKIHAEGNLCYKPKLFTFKIDVCSDHWFNHAHEMFHVEYNHIHLAPVKTLSIRNYISFLTILRKELWLHMLYIIFILENIRQINIAKCYIIHVQYRTVLQHYNESFKIMYHKSYYHIKLEYSYSNRT